VGASDQVEATTPNRRQLDCVHPLVHRHRHRSRDRRCTRRPTHLTTRSTPFRIDGDTGSLKPYKADE